MAAGPLVGGLFTTYLSWRLVFAGEVLIVAAILVLARRSRIAAAARVRLDLVGITLSTVGLALIVFGSEAGPGGWWAQPEAPTWLVCRRRSRCSWPAE